jgi:glyoxylase I family protein
LRLHEGAVNPRSDSDKRRTANGENDNRACEYHGQQPRTERGNALRAVRLEGSLKGPAALGGRTIHVGSDDFYIAVYQPEDSDGTALAHRKGEPLNHVGFQVDDLDETERRAIALGLTPFSHGDYHPGRRFYFFDRDGIEYEIVSYADAVAA